MIQHDCRWRPWPSQSRFLPGVVAAGLGMAAGLLPAAPPVLTHARVVANAAPGHVRVRFEGRDLDAARQVWTASGRRYPVPQPVGASGSERLPLELELAREAGMRLRLEGLRLVTPEGVSNPALILFDSLPIVLDGGAEAAPAGSPRLIPIDSVVYGRIAALRTDRFQVRVRRGIPLSIETYAHRLGSNLDPSIQVRDPAGRIVALNDDDPALGADARLVFAPAVSGLYTVELRDSAYQGGGEFHYHLRIGRFPLVRSVFPPVVPARVPSRVTWLGSDQRSRGTLQLDAPEPGAARVAGFVRGPGSTFSGPVWLRVSPDPIVLRSANQQSGKPVAVAEIPAMAVGRFELPGEPHVYRFATVEGEDIECLAETRSQGSACDVRLTIRDGLGRVLAESDPTQADEGRVVLRADRAGTFDLVVEEINRQAGPAMVYSVGLRRLLPGVELSVETNRFVASATRPAAVTVKVRRRSYDGPVLFALESDPPGARVQEGSVAEKQAEGVIRVLAPSGLQPGEAFRFRLEGVVAVAGKVRRTPVATEPALGRDFPLLRWSPLDEQNWIWAGVVATPEPAP